MPDEPLESTGTPAAPEGAAGAPPEGAAPAPQQDEWADPEPLAEGVQQFDRKYVEQLRDREAKYRIRARELHEQYGTLGEPDQVKAAVELQQRLATEDGAIETFLSLGQALGLGFAEMEEVFKLAEQNAQQQQPNLLEGPDDEPLTRAQVKQLLDEMVVQPQAEAQQQAIIAQASQTVVSTLDQLKVSEEERAAVLAMGQQFIEDNDFDPEHIRAAVRKGNEAWIAAKARDREAYLREKAAAAEGVPANTGGGGAAGSGGEPLPAPKNVAEASVRARAKIRAMAQQQ